MDKEEFESKIKQIRRQKEQAEQELETASEKWRAERRRLNSEIDRLENAVAEARDAAKRRVPVEGKPQGIDPIEVARIQSAAEEKIKQAASEWETERDLLKKQISRLERAVAEAIERSNNPLRATQNVREQLETQIIEITRSKDEVERAYARDKVEWDHERAKLNSELVKLRRTAHVLGRPLPAPDVPEESPKTRELEKEIRDLTAKWEVERRELSDHAGQLQRAFVEAQAKLQNYEAAAKSNEHYETKIQESNRRADALERELQEARNEWTSERRRLSQEIDRLEQQLQRTSDHHETVSNEIVDQLRKQYEQKLQDTITQKTQLAQELQNASLMLEGERARLNAGMSNANTAASSAAGEPEGGTKAEIINAELARVQAMIQDIARLIDDPATDLSMVIRKNVERAELDAYLKGILFSIGKGGSM